jgi:translation initiation factor 2 beta subunit (eIF-2beta)/eIF-5
MTDPDIDVTRASLYTGTIPDTSDDDDDSSVAEPPPRGSTERQRYDRRLLHQHSKFTIWGSEASEASESSEDDDDGALLAEAALTAVCLRRDAAERAVAAFRGGPSRKLVKLATSVARASGGNPFQRAVKLKELSDREVADKLRAYAERFVSDGCSLPPVPDDTEFVERCRTFKSLSTLQRANRCCADV